ncbi:MAG: phosphate ABC transporter permease family protein, partial [Fimbriimonadaceae bacterium]|nr:phosphate ABC transporter permease family protein [Alphaproteobacteria bacterium]
MISITFITILVVAAAGFLVGRFRASRLVLGPHAKLHSLPSYHGAFVAAWVGLPAFFLVLLWLLFQSSVIDALIIGQLPVEKTAGLSDVETGLLLSEIRSIASGNVFGDPDEALLNAGAVYQRWQTLSLWIMFSAVMCLAFAAFAITNTRIAARFKARHKVEKIFDWLMVFCAVIAIFTTIGIVASLVYESIAFFRKVPLLNFLFGLSWEPQIAIRSDQIAGAGAFGAIPVFAGTLLISAIAMLIAVPVGLLSAIYLTEYAGDRFRALAKPALEILAGVPTVVYGFFAVLVIAPVIRQAGQQVGLDIAPNSALAAGLVMGIMII